VDALYKHFKNSKNVEQRKRLQAFWLLRQNHSLARVSEITGVGYRTLQRWIAWYREGGINSVVKRVRGYNSKGSPCKLTEKQQELLINESKKGKFHTANDVRLWIKRNFDVEYTYRGIYPLLRRLQIKCKVPSALQRSKMEVSALTELEETNF